MPAPTASAQSESPRPRDHEPWRDEPLCFSYMADAPRPCSDIEFLDRLPVRIVSVERDGLGLTALADTMAGWTATGRVEGTIEFFVLSGALMVGAERVAGGGYLALSAGTKRVTLRSERASRFLVIRTALRGIEAGRCSVWDEPWSLVMIGGSPTGSSVRQLRQPTGAAPGVVGGSAGAVMLAQLAPGWTSPVMEVHDAWEENLLLGGDLIMAQPGRGVLRPGMNLANPEGHWHGPMATKSGALFIIHCDSPKAIVTRHHPGAQKKLRTYLESALW